MSTEPILIETEYPEHMKLEALRGENETVGAFLEWLEEHGMVIHEWRENLTDVVPCMIAVWNDLTPEEHAERHPRCGRCGGDGYSHVDLEPQYIPISGGIESMLARYYSIDQDKLAAEKAAMLAAIRRNNEREERT